MENFDTNNGLEKFIAVCVKTLDRFALYKKKYLRANNMPFMNKSLSRAFMGRSQLRNKYLKKRSETNRLAYAKQRNFCVSLLRKTKKDYYANLNERDIADNKKFWQTVKPLFSDKVKLKEKITLVQGEMISMEDEKNAELLNAFFSSAVSNLNIPEYCGINILAERISHPTLKAILKYKNHPSIVAINNLKKNFNFHFSVVSEEDFLKEIKKLNPRKTTQSTDIPIKLLKENSDIFASYLCGLFNQSIKNFEFPSILKNTNITPVFKKGCRGSKENYRPVSILPVKKFSKNYFASKLPFSWTHSNQNTNVGLEKVIVCNISY